MQAKSARILWIDIAKGIAIALVVIHHAMQFLDAYGWNPGAFARADTGLTTMRMPLFFTVSGLLAAGAVTTLSLGSLWKKRMLLLVYLYVLWGVIRAIWFTFVPWPLGELDPWLQLLVSPVQPWSGLWYLYALALYMALAWTMRHLPVWAQLTIGAAISVLFASGTVSLGDGYTWRSIGAYFFFFLLGMHAKRMLFAYAERITWVSGLVVLVVYGILALALGFAPSGLRWTGTLPIAIVGVSAGIALAVLLARVPRVGTGLAFLGERTLPVYVMHVFVISALAPLLPTLPVPTSVVIVALAAVAIAVCLLVYRAGRRVPGLFSLPPGLAPRAERAERRPADDPA